MKKILSLLLAFAMVMGLAVPVFAADVPTVSLTADKTSLLAGESVTVTLSIDKSYTNLNDFQFNFYFDPSLVEITAKEIGPACANTKIGNWGPDANGDNYFAVSGIDTDGLPVVLNAGVVATVTFTALADVDGEAKFWVVADSITDYDDFTNAGDNAIVNNVSVTVGEPADDSTVTIPDGAPFTAITTDAGAVVAIEQQENVSFNYADVPYYIVTIPVDAATVYVTDPNQLVLEDYNTGEMKASAYAADIGSGWSTLYVNYDYEEVADGIQVTIPLNMTAEDWSVGTVEMCFVADEDGYVAYAYGGEDSSYACTFLMSFQYAEGGGEEHTCVYDQQNTDAKYLKSAADCENAAVYYYSCSCGETGTETFTSGSANGHDWADATCQAPKKCNTCGEEEGTVADHSYTDGKCIWCGADEPVAAYGYYFATSADISAENGENVNVQVKITGHSDGNVTSYNAYDVTLTFDSDKLEYISYDGAVKSDNGQVKVEGNTIRIVGCGATKTFDDELVTLTFKTKAEGEAEVTISKVQVSDKEESVTEDIPEATAKHNEDDATADTTPEQSVIVVPYSVTKPDFVSGADKALHGESYTFSYSDTSNYTYSGLKVTVAGTEVAPTEENGIYTIENVTGTMVIEATQTANSYDVTKPESVTGPDQATYGTDYVFTVTPGEDMAIESVKVADADGNEISYTINADGEYVIAGTDITGAFTITVTEKEKMTTITFSSIEASEVEGGLTQSAEIGKAFTFKLNKAEGFDYTVMVGTTELTETDGQYTIPADLVVMGGVTVTVAKVDTSKAVVDVSEYINLDGKAMFLVTAKWGDKVLSYGDQTMFFSSKYTVSGQTEAGAYCWLVVSTDEMNTVDLVKAAAEAAIVEAAEGVTATAIGYDYDINETTKVDVNDAQLAYDMYNASYMEFTENLPMLKFLEADMSTDMKLDVHDVAAIINYIVNGASN